MADANPGFFPRLILAWVAFFRVLFDPAFAGNVAKLRSGALPLLPEDAPAREEPGEKQEEPEEKQEEPPKVVLKEATPEAAMQILGLLQREGRFIDFVEEDMGSFSDAQIGAAARIVHTGCRKAIREHMKIGVVETEKEGTKITLEEGFDAQRIRVVGNVVGDPPFTGIL